MKNLYTVAGVIGVSLLILFLAIGSDIIYRAINEPKANLRLISEEEYNQKMLNTAPEARKAHKIIRGAGHEFYVVEIDTCQYIVYAFDYYPDAETHHKAAMIHKANCPNHKRK